MEIYDKLCFFIINEIITNKEITDWQLAKKYSWDDKPLHFENKRMESNYCINKNMCVHNKIKYLEEEGIIKIFRDEKGKISEFALDKNRVIKKRINLPDGNKERFLIKTKNETWVIY